MDDLTFDPRPDAPLPRLPKSASVDPDPLLSRRRLLGGAAGGLVLAASGLLVPEEIAAQRPGERILNDPGERKDGNDKNRNDKNRNDKNRDDKNRDDNDRKAMQGIKDVELNFYSGHTLTHELEVWELIPDTKPENFRLKMSRDKVGPVPPVRQLVKFTGSQPDLVVVVFTAPGTGPLSFRARNFEFAAPRLTVYQSTWDRDGLVDPRARKFVSIGMAEGERACLPSLVVNAGFCVDRSDDSANHKIFYINATD